METKNSQSRPQPPHQHFYEDVDKFRYRSNWSCLIWVVVLLLIVFGSAWWFIGNR